jgi:hypothetical protein
MTKRSRGIAPRAERDLLLGAVAVGLIHAFDDALLNRQPGVSAGQHQLALAAVSVVGAASVVLFKPLRPGPRAAIALVVGAVTATNGALHVARVPTPRSCIVEPGASPVDVPGSKARPQWRSALS